MAFVYRILPEEEFERIRPFCERNNLPMPVPGHNLVAVTEDEGSIVARWDILMQPHLDNGTIDKAYRGKFLNLRRLFRLLEDRIKHIKGLHLYSTSTVTNGSRILEIMGFEQAPAPLFHKDY
jgi:hypothetical protein